MSRQFFVLALQKTCESPEQCAFANSQLCAIHPVFSLILADFNSCFLKISLQKTHYCRDGKGQLKPVYYHLGSGRWGVAKISHIWLKNTCPIRKPFSSSIPGAATSNQDSNVFPFLRQGRNKSIV
jgi:hypothetical protein